MESNQDRWILKTDNGFLFSGAAHNGVPGPCLFIYTSEEKANAQAARGTIVRAERIPAGKLSEVLRAALKDQPAGLGSTPYFVMDADLDSLHSCGVHSVQKYLNACVGPNDAEFIAREA